MRIAQSSLLVPNSITHTHAMTFIQAPIALNGPRIVANDCMRAFRREAELSWANFNRLWMDVCQFLNSPANDTLLDVNKAGQPEYDRQMNEITYDILCSGIFEPKWMGTWTYGRYENEPDLIM